MKLLFLLLVVINLLVFGWEYQRRNQSPQQEIQLQLPDGVQRLRLVGEQPSTETEVVENTEEDVTDPVEPEGGRSIGDEHAAKPTEILGMPSLGAAQAPDAAPGPGAEPEQQGEQTLVGTMESEFEDEPTPTSAEASPDIGVDEPETGSQTAQIAAALTTPAPSAQPPAPRGCFTLGAFKKLSEVEAAGERLETSVEYVDWRQETREKQIGYWVLIPPQASRQAARRKVKELLDAGIEDVWRFTQGDLANAISLGLFSRQAPAERHRQEISRKGFTTEVRPRYVDETFYWLDFRVTDDRELSSELKGELARDYSGAKVSSRECPPDAIP